jgi:hypothetical protein
MATIMSGGGANGGPNGGDRHCTARCHCAKEPDCECICGGRYHGCGSSAKAQEQLTVDWLGEEWRERFGALVQGDPGQQTLGVEANA